MNRTGKALRDWNALKAGMWEHRAGCWFEHEQDYGWQTGSVDPHHIVYRKSAKFDDRRNLALLCRWCHRRVHGETLVIDRVSFGPISYDDVICTKELVDPDFYDPAFLDSLRGKHDR